jgi:hypothetical protein
LAVRVCKLGIFLGFRFQVSGVSRKNKKCRR